MDNCTVQSYKNIARQAKRNRFRPTALSLSPQIHLILDDACQRTQDTKDLHGLYVLSKGKLLKEFKLQFAPVINVGSKTTFSFDDIIDYEYDGDGVEENVILTPRNLLSYLTYNK